MGIHSASASTDSPLSAEIIEIYQRLADFPAQQYRDELLLPRFRSGLKLTRGSHAELLTALDEPTASLRLILGRYAFSKRGKDRDALGMAAAQAVDAGGAPRDLWPNFDRQCRELGRRNPETLNRGLIEGVAELVKEWAEVTRGRGMLSALRRALSDGGHIDDLFLRIVEVPGLGPKTVSMLLRDLIDFVGLEDEVNFADRHYLQPVDRTLRAAASILVPELRNQTPADWIIAGKMAKYARRAGASGVAMNLGLSYLGQRVTRDRDELLWTLRSLVRS